MSEQEDPHKLADELEQQADSLDRHSAEMEHRVDETRQDWQHKRADENVPGAPPLENEDSPTGADEEPPPEARREG